MRVRRTVLLVLACLLTFAGGTPSAGSANSLNLVGLVGVSAAPLAQGPGLQFAQVLSYSSADVNYSTYTPDWRSGSHKATCPDNYRLMGSTNGKWDKVLCIANPSYNYWSELKRIVVTTETNQWAGDWAPGNTKYQCPVGYAVIGVAGNAINGILCELMEGTGNPLNPNNKPITNVRWMWRGDDRGSQSGRDWASGAYKGQCGDSQFVAGIAIKNDEPVGLLCANQIPPVLTFRSLLQSTWKVADKSSEETRVMPGKATRAIDGNYTTEWITEANHVQPHWITIDLGAIYQIGAIYITPRPDTPKQRMRPFVINTGNDPHKMTPQFNSTRFLDYDFFTPNLIGLNQGTTYIPLANHPFARYVQIFAVDTRDTDSSIIAIAEINVWAK